MGSSLLTDTPRPVALEGGSGIATRVSSALALLLIFVLSVVVRAPNLNKPLCRPREWLSATVLRHLQIWHETGISRAHFSPIMTYAGAANKNISNQASDLVDRDGNYYYVSFPPFAYYVPYMLFEGLRIYPGALALQIFSLALHFLCGIFIYSSIKLLLNEGAGFSFSALVGFIAYIFAPQTLWLQSNVYMSDIFVQVTFVVGIYGLLRWACFERVTFLHYFALGMLIFFFVYSEWLGVMFAISMLMYGWLNRSTSWSRNLQLAVLAGALAALGLTVWQYSNIAGLHEFIDFARRQYLMRSGLGAQPEMNFHPWNPLGWLFITTYLLLGYAANFLLLGVLLALARKAPTLNLSRDARLALICGAVLPALLHHLVLFNFTAYHEFSTLKDAPIIAIATGIVAERVRTKWLAPGRQLWPGVALASSLVLFFGAAVAQYRPLAGPPSEGYKRIGDYIAQNSSPDEIVFAQYQDPLSKPLPQMILYAHRNIAVWSDESSARQLAQRDGVHRIVIFLIDAQQTNVIQVRRMEL